MDGPHRPGSATPTSLFGLGRSIRRLAINRLVFAIVGVFWIVTLGTWTLGYVFTVTGTDGGVVFEVVRTAWFTVVYLPVSLFSILVLEPVVGSAFYQIVEPLSSTGTAAVLFVSLTTMYYLIALVVSVLIAIGREIVALP